MTKRISFILYQDLLSTSISLPLEMLQAANDYQAAHGHRKALEIQWLGVNDLAPVKTRGGLWFQPEASLDSAKPSDLIFLPALWRNPLKSLHRHASLVPWLRQQALSGVSICAAATGACFLAETGCLNGKPATTHWYFFDEFSRRYPQVDLKRQYFITQAKELYCTGSVNALADLTVFFIKGFFGDVVAHHVERHFSHEVRQPFEQTSYLDGNVTHHEDEDIVQTQLWMHDNFQAPWSVAEVAKNFGMSVRSFNRRFKQATGQTPVSYLQDIRVVNARELLKNSNLTIGEVADRVGYQDVGHFSALFKQRTHTTPSEFRKSVRRKLFSIGDD